jgi:hypothetical protein
MDESEPSVWDPTTECRWRSSSEVTQSGMYVEYLPKGNGIHQVLKYIHFPTPIRTDYVYFGPIPRYMYPESS